MENVMENNSNRLNARDLINVGIYAAICVVASCAVGMLGIIPVMMLLLVVFLPLITGIPYMMFLTKVNKFGMILLMNIILGLVMWITGMSYYSLIVGTISGLIAEFVYRKGNYKSKNLGILAYAFANIYIWANYFGIFYNAEAYFSTRQQYGQEYIDAVTALLPAWMCPVLLITDFVFSLIGGWFGTKVLKKHFEKAGIA
ncbi:MAG: MptD family putative ECF transporter S component [Eubacterium sp.]|nr:MptD family putative ECF transporter S component [Eubacterium sp.]